MNWGDFLTRLTVWLALCGYAAGAAMMLRLRVRPLWGTAARWAWTLGCVFFLAHVVCAFGFFHHWSHADAVRETARQTNEVTGLRWGGGIFLNYLLAMAWAADVLWWWLSPRSIARRSPRLVAGWHGFFWFMVFNGTVVFGKGPVRWLGVVICGGLVALWLWGRKADVASRRG